MLYLGFERFACDLEDDELVVVGGLEGDLGELGDRVAFFRAEEFGPYFRIGNGDTAWAYPGGVDKREG